MSRFSIIICSRPGRSCRAVEAVTPSLTLPCLPASGHRAEFEMQRRRRADGKPYADSDRPPALRTDGTTHKTAYRGRRRVQLLQRRFYSGLPIQQAARFHASSRKFLFSLMLQLGGVEERNGGDSWGSSPHHTSRHGRPSIVGRCESGLGCPRRPEAVAGQNSAVDPVLGLEMPVVTTGLRELLRPVLRRCGRSLMASGSVHSLRTMNSTASRAVAAPR